MLVFFQYIFNFRRLDRLIGFFNVGNDSSIPTWYSSFTILVCAILLMAIAMVKGKTKDPFFRHWAILSIIFTAISIDEVAMIHENLSDLISLPVDSGFFYYSWVILGIPATIIFVVAYWKFVNHLPRQIKYLFLFSGAIFIIGGLGIEMISAYYDSLYQTSNFTYNWIMIAEEFLEMLGIVIFIYALLTYIQSYLYLTKIEILIDRD